MRYFQQLARAILSVFSHSKPKGSPPPIDYTHLSDKVLNADLVLLDGIRVKDRYNLVDPKAPNIDWNGNYDVEWFPIQRLLKLTSKTN